MEVRPGSVTRAGRDPKVWFDQVEIDAVRGIGNETVRYVGKLYKYYVACRPLSERRQLRDLLLSGSRRAR